MRWGFGLVILTCVGCGTILGAEFDDVDNGPTGAGGVADAGDAASEAAVEAEAGTIIADCATLFVSPSGDDANLGCDSGQPKRTIAAALGTARLSPKVESVQVCAGTFDEHLTLDVDVDLLGGYSCATWERSPTYGFPEFDPTNRTVVGGSKVPETLNITSAAAAATLVDGLTIQGPSGEKVHDGVAVRINGTAKLTVSNCQILGGDSYSVLGEGSVGLRIEDGASPDIGSNLIDGGKGRALGIEADVGRAAIVVDSASPFLHDNDVSGGTGAVVESAGTASIGLVVRGKSALTEAKGNPVLRNVIHGGDGWGPLAGTASIGVLILDESDVDLVESSIQPGHCVGKPLVPPEPPDPPPDLGAAVETRGVQCLSSGKLRVLRSRIYGGDLANQLKVSEGFRVGIWVDGASEFLAENDLVYGGVAQLEFQQNALGGSPSFAIAIAHTSNAIVRHCTLYSGPSFYPTIGTALKMNLGVTNAIIQNNILASDATWNEPIYVEKCASAGVFRELRNNLLFNTDLNPASAFGLLGYGPTPGGKCPPKPWLGLFTVDELETHLGELCNQSTPTACQDFGGTKAADNLTLKAECAGDTHCLVWPECNSGKSLECLRSVFESWSDVDNGFTELFHDGWRLSPKVPCEVARSSLLLPEVGVDLFGKPRTSPASMGAHELDAPCGQ